MFVCMHVCVYVFSPYSNNIYYFSGIGTDHGLTLVLDANLEEYYCASTKSNGFKVSTPFNGPLLWSPFRIRGVWAFDHSPPRWRVGSLHTPLRSLWWTRMHATFLTQIYFFPQMYIVPKTLFVGIIIILGVRYVPNC